MFQDDEPPTDQECPRKLWSSRYKPSTTSPNSRRARGSSSRVQRITGTSVAVQPQRVAFNANRVWRQPTFTVVDLPRPNVRADEVLIRVRARGIRGSDAHLCNRSVMLLLEPGSQPLQVGGVPGECRRLHCVSLARPTLHR